MARMDKLLVEAARRLHAEELFDIVRKNYAEANREYLQKQISIASEYLTDEQKKWLKENGYLAMCEEIGKEPEKGEMK